MKRAPLLLAVSLFVALLSGVSAQCNVLSCSSAFTNSVVSNPTESTLCRAYSTFKSCVTNACGSQLPPNIFDSADKILKDKGITCNSGRNIQFSVLTILGCIYFAFSAFF